MAIETTEKTKLQVYTERVFSPGNLVDLERSLPKHISADRFQRNLSNVLMTNPGWMDLHDPRLIWRECSKAAALGLLLDPHLGEAYLVEAWDGKLKRKTLQLRIGYKGIIKLAKQSGEITKVNSRIVYQHDVIECEFGTDERLVIRPKLFTDRGPVIGVIAVVTFADGETDFEDMSRAQVLDIRNRSDAWKAFSDGKIKSTPWFSDEDEMARKTVMKRLLKRCAQSPEMVRAIAIDEGHDDDPEDRPAPPRKASRMEQVKATIDGTLAPDDPAPVDQAAPQGAPQADGGPQAPQDAQQGQDAPQDAQAAASDAKPASPNLPRSRRAEPPMANATEQELDAWSRGGAG